MKKILKFKSGKETLEVECEVLPKTGAIISVGEIKRKPKVNKRCQKE